MSDYVQALRSKDEISGSLPTLTKEAEAAILDKYKDEVIAAQEGNVKFFFIFKLCKNRKSNKNSIFFMTLEIKYLV